MSIFSLDIDTENKYVMINEDMRVGELIEFLLAAEQDKEEVSIDEYTIVVKRIEEDILMDNGFLPYPDNYNVSC